MSFIVFAMMAFEGSASPERRASETSSPKGLKRVYSIRR